jgi:MFS family permease/SAM-dependent methyltransferase
VSSGPHLFPDAETAPESATGGCDSPDWQPKFFYGVVIFLSAFLLFEVQPLIAKLILPWFGGVASVWAVCLVFFQTVLLLGYLYAHLLTRRFGRRMQGRIHTALLAASLFVLPILPKGSWQPTGREDPAIYILWLLAATIGLPFFLLSSTSPLLQAWYARSRRGASPYRFYSLSNAGSLIALLIYPLVIEPEISSPHQAFGWSGAYIALVALLAALALRRPVKGEVDTPLAPAEGHTQRPGWKLQALWISLAACGSALLLAVTNHITQNVASVPFLWVLPLGLYLFSFILCFEGNWYHRSLFLRLLVVALGGMAYALSPNYAGLPLIVLLPLFCFGLFVCCMFCHGELARLKPEPEHLTLFYVMVALGGAVGAMLVALVAPRVFSGYYELQIALAVCAVLIHVVHRRDPTSPFFKARSVAARAALAALIAVFVGALLFTVHEQSGEALVSVRNFYGVLRVENRGPRVVVAKGDAAPVTGKDGRYRVLINGTIDHGLQFLAPARRDLPTTYYSPQSGIGVTLGAIEGARPLRVGLIGLGTGTIASYGSPGDRYTYYEINPLDLKLARSEFTFLRDSRAKVNVVLGDARLSLEHEPPQHFDVLAVDAFTGDSIPVHLLTLQAFRLYFRQLQPQGVLAVHISNRYLNLEPVVEAAATRLHKEAVEIVNPDDHSQGIFKAVWIVMGNQRGFLGRKKIEAAGFILHPTRRDRLWTDDYSSLFTVIK